MTTDPMADATPRANIYFAGPLFTHAECRWNREIALALETLGYVVSLPQRLVADLVTLGAPLPTEEIFDRLVRQIREVDVVVAVLDGPDDDPSAVTGLAERLSVAMDHLPRASGDEG